MIILSDVQPPINDGLDGGRQVFIEGYIGGVVDLSFKICLLVFIGFAAPWFYM